MSSEQYLAKIVEIDNNHSGQRIDNYLLGQLKGVSKNHIYKLLRSGQVRVNKGRKKPDYRLQVGDAVRIPPVRMPSHAEIRVPDQVIEQLESLILFEDNNLLVLNKPSGLAVHGGSGLKFGVIEAMKQSRDNQFLELAHRLDRETSGCLLLAKNRSTLTHFHQFLRNEKTEIKHNRPDIDPVIGKHYLALVKGHWSSKKRIDAPLIKLKRSGEFRVEVSNDTDTGQRAISFFSPEKHYENSTLMSVSIATGRTHQIRVHASSHHHPIAGDEKYGDQPYNLEMKSIGLNRLFLHASRIEVPAFENYDHDIIVEAPLSDDLQSVLDNLV